MTDKCLFWVTCANYAEGGCNRCIHSPYAIPIDSVDNYVKIERGKTMENDNKTMTTGDIANIECALRHRVEELNIIAETNSDIRREVRTKVDSYRQTLEKLKIIKPTMKVAMNTTRLISVLYAVRTELEEVVKTGYTLNVATAEKLLIMLTNTMAKEGEE